jgi:hypothetical protein
MRDSNGKKAASVLPPAVGCSLPQSPAFGPFTDLEHEVPGFSKKHVGAVAAAMEADDIPAEVADFLRRVREASRA